MYHAYKRLIFCLWITLIQIPLLCQYSKLEQGDALGANDVLVMCEKLVTSGQRCFESYCDTVYTVKYRPRGSLPDASVYLTKGNSNFELGTAICFMIVRK